MGMVGCWRGGDTWWGISERQTPFERGISSRAVESMRYSIYGGLMVFENVVGENLREKRGREMVEIGWQRIFGRAETFGGEII